MRQLKSSGIKQRQTLGHFVRLKGGPPLDNSDKHRYNCEHKQYMDEATENVTRDDS
jgi:hypothetical protein